MDMTKDFVKSGEIARKAREYGITLIKEGAKFIDIADKIEAKIISLGGKPGFPCDVSVNYIAAHDCPLFNDERVIKKGDLVKLDIGVHVDGAVTDTAVTVEAGTNKNKKLIEAGEKALDEAIKLAKPGVKVNEIGKKIQEVIQSYGFSPIVNLSGHGVGEYEVHTKPTIPNHDNGDETVLKKGDKIAIEPFATTGEGKVIEGKDSEVYEIMNPKNTRNRIARDVLKFILEEYQQLPFCSRWLIKKFGLKAKLALKLLERDEIIKQFKQLPEGSKGLVSQAEHTLIVGDKVLT
jgi:methionyl aminopeptidase